MKSKYVVDFYATDPMVESSSHEKLKFLEISSHSVENTSKKGKFLNV